MLVSDNRLKLDVEQELRWEPALNSVQIEVSVEKGKVSLAGTVVTYSQKWAAEAAAGRVNGVRSIVRKITVTIVAEHRRTDSEIAATTLSVLSVNLAVPKTVTYKVDDGWVTLEGRTTRQFERAAAERAVGHIKGVVGIRNNISVGPDDPAEPVKEDTAPQ